ncbi:MAG: hypothetical protein AAGF12_14580 [Myxococcota bacterium]
MRWILVLVCPFVFIGCGDAECPTGTVDVGERCVVLAGPDGGRDAAAVVDGAVDGGSPDRMVGALACVPAGPDLPDPDFVDSDCDGIDGAAELSVFLSATGSDENPGTQAAPVATFQRALSLAVADGKSAVLVAVGEYREPVVLAEGIGIHGGYDPDDWSRSASRPLVTGPSPVLFGAEITRRTVVDGMEIRSDAAVANESSIAMRLVRSTGVLLVRSIVASGAGGAGEDGEDARRPASEGRDGAAGGDAKQAGQCPGVTSVDSPPALPTGAREAAPCSCGAGGNGGRAGFYRFADGFVTTAAAGGLGSEPAPVLFNGANVCPFPGGATGGAPGRTGSRNGRPGSPGADGRAGQDGEGGSGVGAFSEEGYLPADGEIGETGTAGAGGAGGGGGQGCVRGDFCFVSGGAGGAGGSGGCGGTGGGGGKGGGGSIALLLFDSNIVLRDTHLESGVGGAGGDGARGASGTRGGRGGSGGRGLPSDCGTTGVGGDGGPGGEGGMGGAGGGGGGGPSVPLVLAGMSGLDDSSERFELEFAAGGPGGSGAGRLNNGRNGAAEQLLDVRQ